MGSIRQLKLKKHFYENNLKMKKAGKDPPKSRIKKN